MMAAEPRVVSCIKKFMLRLGEFKDTVRPVNLNYALLSLSVGRSAPWKIDNLGIRY
jgi:hypothetical protein